MKWLLLLVIIGLTVFTYTQNQRIEALSQELAAVKADAEPLQKRVQATPPPRNPFLERQSTMLGNGSAMSGTSLDQRPQGNDGPNRGGGKGRH